MAGLSHADTFIVDVPTIRPHVLAMATMHAQSMVIVRLTDADGIEGIGEGTTIGGLSYGEESPESIKSAIDTYIVPVLETCDLAQVGATMAKVARCVRGNHFAKCAVETALLDMTCIVDADRLADVVIRDGTVVSFFLLPDKIQRFFFFFHR